MVSNNISDNLSSTMYRESRYTIGRLDVHFYHFGTKNPLVAKKDHSLL